MIIKVLLTLIFLAIMVAVGVVSRKQASSVDGFVLGGRSVGPWLTAFAYGTSYFSAVVRRLCRTVRLEIWSLFHVDRCGQRPDWFALGVVGLRTTHQTDDAAH